MSSTPSEETTPAPASQPRQPDPTRFSVSKGTLRLDAFMTRFIFAGGLGVLLAIAAIFIFILVEIVPLFQGAKVKVVATIQVEESAAGQPLLLGTDEWAELPFILRGNGQIDFLDTVTRSLRKSITAPLPSGAHITSAEYVQPAQAIVIGLSNGGALLGTVAYEASFAEDMERTIDPTVSWDPVQKLSPSGEVVAIAAYIGGRRKTIAAIIEDGDVRRVQVVSLVQQRSLFGVSGYQPESSVQLQEEFSGRPVQVLVGSNAETLVVRTEADEVHFFRWENRAWQLRQTFSPLSANEGQIASMNFIQGEVSLSFTSTSGAHVLYSLYHRDEAGERLFGRTKDFAAFPGGARFGTNSLRNKSLLLTSDDRISLRYATTASVRWEAELDSPVRMPVINGKGDTILGLTSDNDLVLYSLHDPHPEAGVRAFFGKVWYEGQSEPEYKWQSTGGSDDFEPKISLVPLIVGSLKGTFYALILAIPIALLAAIYTSQFLQPDFRRVIKPTIEIMASLPSVVLGFLGALWLAPILEDRVPSVLMVTLSIPIAAVLIGYAWSRLPIRYRIWVPVGYEAMFFMPLIIVVSLVAWQLGPVLEAVLFRYTDPTTGQQIGDFRLWWEAWTGNQFQQRNSMIVGFMMGFAVIPIIFTITDDALNAVPGSLTSASLALGASRWQTAARIVLPTASAGIFSACMIGFGRAVGETMIVVMATGNTPIMDFDIFSGMRTLSANIAVELPEAPHGGTLYRTLFLGAFVLFVLTFAINTLAEILRHRLRDRYKMN